MNYRSQEKWCWVRVPPTIISFWRQFTSGFVLLCFFIFLLCCFPKKICSLPWSNGLKVHWRLSCGMLRPKSTQIKSLNTGLIRGSGAANLSTWNRTVAPEGHWSHCWKPHDGEVHPSEGQLRSLCCQQGSLALPLNTYRVQSHTMKAKADPLFPVSLRTTLPTPPSPQASVEGHTSLQSLVHEAEWQGGLLLCSSSGDPSSSSPQPYGAPQTLLPLYFHT